MRIGAGRLRGHPEKPEIARQLYSIDFLDTPLRLISFPHQMCPGTLLGVHGECPECWKLRVFSSMGIESDALARVLAPQVMLWLEFLRVERPDNTACFLGHGHAK